MSEGRLVREQARTLRRLFASGIWGASSTLFSFPMTGVGGGRQGFGETGVLIGRAHGKAFKVRSA